MSRWVVKLLALVGTFLLPLICTLLPYKVSGYIARRGASGKRLLSYLMCFGGGIFFGTYLLHMGPEVQTILKDSLLDPYGITYPVAELIVGVGFFIVLFAEKLVLRWNKRRIRLKQKEASHQPTATEMSVNGAKPSSSNRGKCARPPSEEMCHECIDGKQCSGHDENMYTVKLLLWTKNIKIMHNWTIFYGVPSHTAAVWQIRILDTWQIINVKSILREYSRKVPSSIHYFT